MKFYIVIVLFVAGCTTEPGSQSIPRPSVFAPGLMRGGQPKEPEDFRRLVSMGYTNVVKLNTGPEPGAVEAGMRVVRYPITTWQQIFGPCEYQIRAAADFCAAHPGTFLHCTHGVNRTGTVVIFYRMYYDHWRKDLAIAEADTFGWESSLPALKKAVRDFVPPAN